MKKVSKKNLIQRINRQLGKNHLKLKTNTSKKWQKDLGDYYVLDSKMNAVIHDHVDLETFGREKGVLKDNETLRKNESPKKGKRKKLEIQKEDLRGFYLGNQLLCTDCYGDGDVEKAEQILTIDQVREKTEEGTFILCDRCKKRIKA